MNKAEQSALEELEALLKLGERLKIITAERRRNASEPETSPAAWVQHDAVRVEEVPNQPEQIRVWSDEGDYVQGRPSAVLRRLREWQGEP